MVLGLARENHQFWTCRNLQSKIRSLFSFFKKLGESPRNMHIFKDVYKISAICTTNLGFQPIQGIDFPPDL